MHVEGSRFYSFTCSSYRPIARLKGKENVLRVGRLVSSVEPEGVRSVLDGTAAGVDGVEEGVAVEA